jgi:hypothetical protein
MISFKNVKDKQQHVSKQLGNYGKRNQRKTKRRNQLKRNDYKITYIYFISFLYYKFHNYYILHHKNEKELTLFYEGINYK